MNKLTYYWYSFNVGNKYNPEYINKLILEHNWDEFEKIKSEFDQKEEQENACKRSFPNDVYDEKNDEMLRLTKETFMNIGYAEYENG